MKKAELLMNDEKNKRMERIWNIRNFIQELEDIKEGIN